jgi:hypothetical protein
MMIRNPYSAEPLSGPSEEQWAAESNLGCPFRSRLSRDSACVLVGIGLGLDEYITLTLKREHQQ